MTSDKSDITLQYRRRIAEFIIRQRFGHEKMEELDEKRSPNGTRGELEDWVYKLEDIAESDCVLE